MPSGWMPDARHDLRMRSAFPSSRTTAYRVPVRTVKHAPVHWTWFRRAHRNTAPHRVAHS